MFKHLIAAAAACLSGPVVAQAGSVETEQRMPHISVLATGRGSPVILIPGLSSPRAVWDGVVPELARHHRVYLVQVNGFGGDPPDANLRPGILDGIVAELHALIAREKLGHAAVIGHSMGGLTALMLARAHPDDVSRLMIVDALPFVGEIFVPHATVAMLSGQAAAMRDAMAANFGKPTNPAATAALAATQALTPPARAKVAAWVAHADARVSAQAMFEDLSTDLRPAMAAIATPITLVYPWSDAMPRARATAFYTAAYAAAPRVSFVAIGGSGHFVMLDQPAAFAAAVAAFVAERGAG